MGYCQSHSSCFGNWNCNSLPGALYAGIACFSATACPKWFHSGLLHHQLSQDWLCLQLGLHSHCLCFSSLLCANWHHDGCQQNGMAASTAQLSTKLLYAQYEVLTNDWHRALRLKYYNLSRIKFINWWKTMWGKLEFNFSLSGKWNSRFCNGEFAVRQAPASLKPWIEVSGLSRLQIFTVSLFHRFSATGHSQWKQYLQFYWKLHMSLCFYSVIAEHRQTITVLSIYYRDMTYLESFWTKTWTIVTKSELDCLDYFSCWNKKFPNYLLK